jgi:hypothetical protein
MSPNADDAGVSSPSNLEDEANFRRALRDLRDRGFGSQLALGSLLASIDDDARYRLIAREELAPRAGEMDLHLSGEEVIGHSANAAAFGIFVKRIADSVKVISRERLSRRSMVSDLLVEPGPGSVRVVFRTPDPVPSGAIEADPNSSFWSDPNQQTLALQEVATLLANADPDSPDASVVDGLVEVIPLKARAPLLSAIREVAKQEWIVEGEFRQRGLGLQPIRLGASGARRLRAALEVRQRGSETLVASGVIDGHRRARGLCWFIEDGTAREITAVVPTAELMSVVAELDASDQHHVIAKFTVFITYGPGQQDAGSRSFVLDEIRSLPETPGLDLERLTTP